MKVVLTKDVENVGKAGQQKEVADGFAQNFLLPNGLAQKATLENVAKAEQLQEKMQQDQAEELEEVQKAAAKAEGQELVFQVKTEGEKLFGSIDKKNILEKISELKIATEGVSVELPKPLKELGEFPVKLLFAHGIEAKIKVIIEKE